MISEAPRPQARKQLPCRPDAATKARIYEIQRDMGISTTAVITVLLKMGIELRDIRAAGNLSMDSRLSNAEFWKKALPFIGGH